ncbi:hypothetical protein N9S63_00750 [OM182 bacterium]|nr:hypothetical protein [OM182 bacterium]
MLRNLSRFGRRLSVIVIWHVFIGQFALVIAMEDLYIESDASLVVPDLQGIWSIATQTNLERAERFQGKLVLTEEEANGINEAYKLIIDATNKPSDPGRDAPDAGVNVGGYNTFWMDPGEQLAVIDGKIRTSIIIDPPNGKLPYSKQGKENYDRELERRRNYDGPEVRPLGERCVVGFGSTGGPPKLPVLYNNNTQIVQTPGYVVLLAEMNHDVRVIRLNSTHSVPSMDYWMGDSVGHYEDGTLVVVTTNFHLQQNLRSSLDHRFYASPSAVVTEYFTRTGPTTIRYEFSVDDPANYTQVWRGQLPMNKTDDGLFEYACHEGNYALPGILAGARRAEADGADYATTYSR